MCNPDSIKDALIFYKEVSVNFSDSAQTIDDNLQFESQLAEYNVGFALSTMSEKEPETVEKTLLVNGYINSSYDNTFVSYQEVYYHFFFCFYLFFYMIIFAFLLVSQYRFNLENNVYLSTMLLLSFSAWFENSFNYLNYSSITSNGKYIQLFAAGANIFGDIKVLCSVYFVTNMIIARDLTETQYVSLGEHLYKKGFYSFAVTYVTYRVLFYGKFGSLY